ncbi:hypothetical protein [Cupriavidus pinatubonensis]|uniref:hypothetical protein n=1 Tax=Cupriavidus pinatubonensis TaxID=248026 RepID=UPI001CC738A9|nr:hypothetical protein [Cupriavidus pinatubonensis]
MSVGFGWLPALFEAAFSDGAAQLLPTLDTLAGDRTVAEGVVGVGVERVLRFGHLPMAELNIPTNLSGAAPYRLTLSFEEDDLATVDLTLFLLNPRVLLTQSLFIPSHISADGRFEPLTAGPAPCGLLLVVDPTIAAADRFEKLKEGLPAAAFTQPPADTVPYAEDSLLARLDISIVWKRDELAKYSTNMFGEAMGMPDAALPKDIPLVTVDLFSSDLPDPVHAFMDRTRTIGLTLEHEIAEGIHIILGKPAKSKTRELLDEALAEFNIAPNFKGVLFEGLKAHWLDDEHRGHANFPNIGVSLCAFSFESGGNAKNFSQWYATFEAELPPKEDEDSYLWLFDELRLHAGVGGDNITNVGLTGTFKPFEENSLYSWLTGRSAVISWHEKSWKDVQGKEQSAASLSIGLEAAENTVLATIDKDTPVAIPEALFHFLAVGMTLAPIVLATNPLSAPTGAHAALDQSRDFFVKIGGAQRLAELYMTAALGFFFKNMIRVEELRVVGIRLQRQPAQLTDPNADANRQLTALLFDYEVDYQIKLPDADIGTARAITARIDGTGFVIEKDDVSWVQVPAGVRDLSIADPSLWELGPFGRFLKVVDITLRREPYKQLAIRLRLMGNTDIITAGDFVFIIPLEGDDPPSIEAFPSLITMEIPGLGKGTGTLVISKDAHGRTIVGSLDLVTPTGLRVYCAVKLINNSDLGDAKAIVASFKTRFRPPNPVFGTGIGWSGVDGIVATHMKRLEPPPGPAAPPALQWLKSVDGDVVESVAKHADKWVIAKDQSSIGVGVMLEFMVSGELLNLNAMLAIERPGPRILIFAKANLLKVPVENEKAAGDLERGIIGILDVDLGTHKLTLSALANLQFKDFIKVLAPLEFFFDMEEAANAHFYLGHHANPVSAELDLFKILKFSAHFYFMADGKLIADVPVSPNDRRNLPGFAMALGFGSQIQIGGGPLYVRGSFDTYLTVALGEGIFASGAVVHEGELHLWIVTIGASATLQLQYQRNLDGSAEAFLEGQICGHYKNFFIEVEGCVTLRIGAPLSPALALPALTADAKLLAGTDVALFGQGRLGPIDAVLADAAITGGAAVPPVGIPLDAVIAIAMARPPAIAGNAKGFAAHAPVFNQNGTSFQFNNARGRYVLKDVRLVRLGEDGSENEVDPTNCPARWWESGQSDKGGHPTPKTLALMTRSPLSVQNAIVDPAQLKSWVDAILGGLCDQIITPQSCWYALTHSDVRTEPRHSWTLEAVLRDMATERTIGRSGASSAILSLLPRLGFGTQGDPAPGYPQYPGNCRIEADPKTGGPVPVLRFYKRTVLSSTRVSIESRIALEGDMLSAKALDILIAHTPLKQLWHLELKVYASDGTDIPIDWQSVLAGGGLQDLLDPAVQADFHEDAENWRPAVEAFARLSQLPCYAGYQFRRVRIDLSTLGFDPAAHPIKLMIGFNGDAPREATIDAILGGVRFAPLAEQARYEEDLRHQAATIGSLQDFLDGKPIPLLEPKSTYELRVAWDAEIEGGPTRSQSSAFRFETVNEPPAAADPYLLATFPQMRERFHNADDMPGFALGSIDLLRILAKFSDARLRVVITDDGGMPVEASEGAFFWNDGILVAPAELIDPTAPAPAGFYLDAIASLPSALRNAIHEKLADGSLHCLGDISLPEGGIWIGFKALLRPLSSYRIEINIVHADGTSWTWASPPPGPFLQWQFSTSLSANLPAHAGAITNARPRHKMLRQALPDLLAHCPREGIMLAEKSFEDSLAFLLGERSDRSEEAQCTILWRRDEIGMQFLAAAVLVESREPLLRTTQSVKVGPISQIAGDGMVASPQALLLQSIDLGTSTRAIGLAYASSGFAALIRLDEADGSDLVVQLRRHEVERIPVTSDSTSELQVPASVLAPRPLRAS